jgi:hypothetical protein
MDNMQKIDYLTKRSSELLADMRRLEKENQKNRRQRDNLQKERDNGRTELSKTVGLKEKLEKLCRELQRDNNKMKVSTVRTPCALPLVLTTGLIEREQRAADHAEAQYGVMGREVRHVTLQIGGVPRRKGYSPKAGRGYGDGRIVSATFTSHSGLAKLIFRQIPCPVQVLHRSV